jgi:hypothetical protein
VIELHDDANPEAIVAMLRHLYGSDYEDQDLGEDETHLAALHLWVFMLGDKYDISSLRDNAVVRFDAFISWEERSDYYFPTTIHAIQKLLGPEAPQLADQALVLSTTEFVLENYMSLIQDETFRSLLAKGAMLKNDLAIQFLDRVSNRLQNS